MMTNDLRNYIQIVESQGQLDEAGGFLDRMLSRFGKIPGLKRTALRAGGRVSTNELANMLRDAWTTHAAATDTREQDSEAIKGFFKRIGLDDSDISELEGLEGPRADLKRIFQSAAVTIKKIIGPAPAKVGLDKGKKKPKKIKARPTGVDLDSNLRFFKTSLSGNPKNAVNEALRIRKNPKAYKDRPLALLGWAYLEANGLEK